jgi:hypothetical protein
VPTVVESPAGTQPADSAQDGYALSTEMELLVGTLRLDGTDLAVSAGQAGALFSLWARMKTTLAGMTPTVGDIQAVTDQILSAMTPDQLQAIHGVNLSFHDLTALAEKMNISFGHWRDFDADDFLPTENAAPPDEVEPPPFPGGGDMERWSHMIPRELMDAFLAYLQGKQ